jgi:hypothetical protein
MTVRRKPQRHRTNICACLDRWRWAEQVELVNERIYEIFLNAVRQSGRLLAYIACNPEAPFDQKISFLIKGFVNFHGKISLLHFCAMNRFRLDQKAGLD